MCLTLNQLYWINLFDQQASDSLDPVASESIVVSLPVPTERRTQKSDSQTNWGNRDTHLLLDPAGEDSHSFSKQVSMLHKHHNYFYISYWSFC
jgi:hypothetical protein